MRSNGRTKDIAEQAWGNLSSAVESGGDLAKSVGKRTRDLAGEAGSRVTSRSREAKDRADRALDALAGRQPSKPWGLFVGLAAAGLLVGWVAATFGKRAVEQAQTMIDRAPQQDDLRLSDDDLI